MKKLLITTVIIAVFIYLGYQSLLKGAAEKAASYALGTEVTIGYVALMPLSGEATIGDVKVANVGVFKSPHLATLDKLYVSLDIMSLLSDAVKVNTIDVQGLALTYETNGKQSNLEHFKSQFSGGSDTNEQAQSSAKTEPAGESKPTKQFSIDTLELSNAQINLASSIPVLPGKQSIAIPTITLKDIGKEGGAGKSVKQVVHMVVEAINQNVTQQVGGPIFGSIKALGNLIKDAPEKLIKDTIKGTLAPFKALGDALKNGN